MRPLACALPLFLLMGLAPHARAVDFGIGVSVKNNENSLFLPLRLNENWLLEGQLQAMKTRQTVDGTEPAYGYTNSYLRAGLGIFWTRKVAEKTHLLMGSRFSHIKRTFGGFGSEDTASGWDVAPTAGLEYFPVRWFSIGGEVAYGFERIKGNNSWHLPVAGESPSYRTRSQETRSAIILRAYF